LKKPVRIKGSGKAFSLYAGLGTEAEVLAEGQSGLVQDTQIQGRHIFSGPDGIVHNLLTECLLVQIS
jgi:hypothetical protein